MSLSIVFVLNDTRKICPNIKIEIMIVYLIQTDVFFRIMLVHVNNWLVMSSGRIGYFRTEIMYRNS